MEYNPDKKMVTIFGKNEKLDTLANRLSNLSGDQVYSMFSNRGIAVPRRLNCLALYSVINQRLKNIHASELSKDYFFRLRYYKEFSEFQLINLFSLICNTSEEFKMYRVNLFKLIIINYVGLNLNDGEIKYLKDLKKLSIESFDVYSSFISAMCHEQNNTFDGQDIKVLEDCLINSATSNEIMSLASKYGLSVPTKLKKNEIIENIYEYYDKQGKLTIELKDELASKNITELNAFCKSKKLPFSSSMTKNEMIYYLFYSLSNCEIVTTSVNRIESPDEFLPLDITIDMQAFKGFSACDDRRIVLYPGCENDEFNVLPKDLSEELDNKDFLASESTEDVKKDIALDINNDVTPISEGSVDIIDVSSKMVESNDINTALNINESNDIATPSKEDDALVLNQNDDLSKDTVDLKEDDNALDKAIDDGGLNDPKSLGLDDVTLNDHFGDESILKSLESPLRWLWISLGIVGVILIIGFIIWLVL